MRGLCSQHITSFIFLRVICIFLLEKYSFCYRMIWKAFRCQWSAHDGDLHEDRTEFNWSDSDTHFADVSLSFTFCPCKSTLRFSTCLLHVIILNQYNCVIAYVLTVILEQTAQCLDCLVFVHKAFGALHLHLLCNLSLRTFLWTGVKEVVALISSGGLTSAPEPHVLYGFKYLWTHPYLSKSPKNTSITNNREFAMLINII